MLKIRSHSADWDTHTSDCAQIKPLISQNLFVTLLGLRYLMLTYDNAFEHNVDHIS